MLSEVIELAFYDFSFIFCLLTRQIFILFLISPFLLCSFVPILPFFFFFDALIERKS